MSNSNYFAEYYDELKLLAEHLEREDRNRQWTTYKVESRSGQPIFNIDVIIRAAKSAQYWAEIAHASYARSLKPFFLGDISDVHSPFL